MAIDRPGDQGRDLRGAGPLARDISVLIPTYERGAELRVTLEALARLRRDDLAVEFVVIDNNSRDDTSKILEEFAGRLPLRALFEPLPGKNRALNRALGEAPLGRLVAFTDDDATPQEDWLLVMGEAAQRHPECSVFGGRVEVQWPGPRVPGWATHPKVRGWGFSHLDLGPETRPWPERRFPVGLNYWVRREVFAGARRFADHLGPRPRARIMGDEAAFLKGLSDEGYAIRYVPESVVRHRVQPEMVTVAGLRRRAIYVGRSGPHLWGPARRDLLERRPWPWTLVRLAALARAGLAWALASLRPASDDRVVGRVEALRDVAYNWENLRLARSARGADS